MFIWRVVLEKLVTIGELKSGEVDIVDLLKLNALLDLRQALEKREMERTKVK